MILVDYSQVVIAGFFANGAVTQDPDPEFMRHVILNMLRSYHKKWSKKYGRLIICADGKSPWRRGIFPYYKAGRAKAKEESSVDWNKIFETMGQMFEDIRSVSLYPCIKVDGAEADDIIGHLARKSFRDSEKTLIISSDKDFIQLQKYAGIEQYSPTANNNKGKFLTTTNPSEYLTMHIIRAGDDGIPNIFSDDDTFVNESKRQGVASKKRIQQMMDYIYSANSTNTDVPAQWKENFERNRCLIDLDLTPADIDEKIKVLVEQEFEKTPNKSEFLSYLIKNRCQLLVEDIQDFFLT